MTEKEKQLALLIERRQLSDDLQQFVDRRESDDVPPVTDLRCNDSDRRDKDENRRACFRFSVESSDDSIIIIRTQRKTIDENGDVIKIEEVDTSYDIKMIDKSAGGFGFHIDSSVPLKEGHVVRLAEPGGMHLVGITGIRENVEDETLHVGGQFLDDLFEEPPQVSVLELLVERRERVGPNSRPTLLVVGGVALVWSLIAFYTIYM